MPSRPVRALQRVLSPVATVVAARRLARAAGGVQTTPAVLDLAYSFSFAGVRIEPMQVRSELAGLLGLLAEPPRGVLEIGTASGGTLFTLARTAAPDARLVSLDLPRGPFGGGYPSWRRPLYRSFARDGQTLVLLRADSHGDDALAAVQAALGGRALDLLLVDGDHSYEGVRSDVERYGPLLRAGGILALHDIVPASPPAPGQPNLLVGGVPSYWRELRERYRHEELVEDWAQDGYGLGVLRWPLEEQSGPGKTTET
jgi:predicted O-methyltransferase YrrM